MLWQVAPGDTVRAGDVLVVLQAMKMEHELRATSGGRIDELFFSAGEAVEVGQTLLRTEAVVHAAAAVAPQPGPLHDRWAAPEAEADTAIRRDLQQVLDRHALTLDANRPAAMHKRRALGPRSARENLVDLYDDGSFSEYGALAEPGQIGPLPRSMAAA